MKNLLIILFAIVTVAAFVPVQKAQATFGNWGDWNICDYVPCNISVSPSPSIEPSDEPSVEPSVEPSIEVSIEPTATPTAAPTSTGDGKGDGRSDGLSSCPDCTKAHVLPAGAPATGRGR
jgi:hypothetical protein